MKEGNQVRGRLGGLVEEEGCGESRCPPVPQPGAAPHPTGSERPVRAGLQWGGDWAGVGPCRGGGADLVTGWTCGHTKERKVTGWEDGSGRGRASRYSRGPWTPELRPGDVGWEPAC